MVMLFSCCKCGPLAFGTALLLNLVPTHQCGGQMDACSQGEPLPEDW